MDKHFTRMVLQSRPTTWSEVKGALFEGSQTTSTHGLPNIVRARRNWLRLIWLACFLISAGVCANFMRLQVQSYLAYDVVTQIRVVPETETVFPTVTICNVNDMSIGKAKVLAEKLMVGANLDKLRELYDNVTFPSTNDEYFQLARRLRGNLKLNSSVMQSIEEPLENVVISCMFNDVLCDFNDFKWYLNLNAGNCIQFNTGFDANGAKRPIRTVARSGWHNGLQIQLFVGVDDEKTSFETNTGVRVFINNPWFSPKDAGDIILSTNSHTDIIVTRLEIEKWPYPYSKCYDETVSPEVFERSVLYREIRSQGKQYKQSDCFEYTIQYFTIKRHNCSIVVMPPVGDTPLCTGDQEHKAQEDFKTFPSNSEFLLIYAELCPLECKSVVFEFTPTYLDYPSTEYMKLLRKSLPIHTAFPNNTITDAQLKNSVLSFNLFYDELQHTTIKEMPNMDLVGLISALGGTLGVFLGMSLLTFVEYIEIGAEVLFVLWENRATRRTTQPINP